MSNRHKVFVSYHHALDEEYKAKFEQFGSIFDVNSKCEFVVIYNWSDNPTTVQDWIHQAYLRKSTKLPDNSRAPFGKNRTGDTWTD